MIQSKLDNDLYKLTMQQGVTMLYPRAWARFEFINRGGTQFRNGFGDGLRNNIRDMQYLKLSEEQEVFLRNLSYFTPAYIDFYRGFRFNHEEVTIVQNGGDLKIVIEGPWYSAMMWEVTLMALISEMHCRGLKNDPSWGKTTAMPLNKHDMEKGNRLAAQSCNYADFGTRRRYSYDNHERAVIAHSKSSTFVGTSNLHLAHKLGLRPIGTQAHEWFMFHAAIFGPQVANKMALEQWVNVYQGDLGIALTDTFTTENFFQIFDRKYAKLFDGVRHDSGDPIGFFERVVSHYKSLGIDPQSKTIVFSDGLDPDEAIEIRKAVGDTIKCSFGIGTNISNDIEGIKPLNMVIKMVACKLNSESPWIPTVKLSDVSGKHTGDPDEIELYKRMLRLV